MERVPGGMMIVPLALGALLATFAPGTPARFGSFTGALFTGALPIMAVFYVCMGSTISVRTMPGMLRRGGLFLAAKIILGIGSGILFGRLLGTDPVHTGFFAGISTLAIVAAINDTNGGLYMALMEQYGTAEDVGAYSVMALESGPFFTMITLGTAGLTAFPWQTLLGAVLPLMLGIVLGNLDPELRAFLARAVPVLIPFYGFALGSLLDLHQVWQAGLLGILLGLSVVLLSGVLLIVADRISGGTGTTGIAAATTAANAAAVPALVASANPAYAAAARPATVLVAASMVVSTLLVPFLTTWWYRRTHKTARENA